ncbi:MAG: acetyl-CoA hydrolase/transferase C-terminal domain-containing protein [bacterium]|nr:acetyl-CoA hydrolase/transferase C-terminal domain-containing protein [bacterium]
MNKITSVEDVINKKTIPPGSIVYVSGNAATPQLLLKQLAADESIKEIDIYSVLPLGSGLEQLYSEERCRDITHRVIFNSALTREAVNKGWAYYCPIHLSEIPRYLKEKIHPSVVLLSVSGPDQGGNYSLGTTVEAVLMAIRQAKDRGGLVIAERNARMPFVQGTTIHKSKIDYLIDSDYNLPISPVHQADENARRIGEIIAALYIQDGSKDSPGSTLQYGIGEVPEAVTTAILRRGIKDLSIHTELFAGAMARLVKVGAVTNRWKKHLNFSVASIFLAEDQAGYDWMHNNSAIQSRPSNYTNSVFKIAEHPRMVSINSAIGVDLHGNIWADSLDARKIYSGIGGQADFIRGARWSEGGVAIIALKARTSAGLSKVVDMCPAGITTTAIPADQVILVTENGAMDPRGLSLGERAVAIAHLAHEEEKEKLLRIIYENPAFHKPDSSIAGKVPGFVPYEEAMSR